MPLARIGIALWTATCVGLAVLCATLLWRGAPIQTDLLALLPRTESNPNAERAAAALAAAGSNRVVILVSHTDPERSKAAARELASHLRASHALQNVTAEVPPLDPSRIGSLYAPYRFGLLSEADRIALQRGEIDPQAWLVRRLASPVRLQIAGSLGADPFGLLDAYVLDLPYRHIRLSQDDGLLVAEDPQTPERMHVLVTAELPRSAFDDTVQKPVVAAVAAAEAAVQSVYGVQTLHTGAVFYAESARRAASREMDWIGAISIAGIVVLLAATFRSIVPLALGLFVVGIALTVATAVVLSVHRELHLLTLVFGASLIGEAIDYPIQYFAAYAEAGAKWDARRGLTEILPGLTLALLTSALGYAALTLMPFPAVSQIALFALTGLTAAYLSVVLLLPGLLARPHRRDLAAVVEPARRFVAACRRRMTPARSWIIGACVIVLCIPGWTQLHSHDDVRSMATRPPHLLEQETRIRAITGLQTSSEFFLIEGDTVEEVLQREEALGERLRGLAERRVIAHFQGVSAFVPSRQRQTENRDLVERRLLGDSAALRRTLDAVGFPPDTAAQLIDAYRASAGRWLDLEHWLASPAAGAFRHLWLGKTDRGYAAIVMPAGHQSSAPLKAAADGLQGVSFVDKVGSVSRLLRDYRVAFGYGLILAGVLALLILSRRYRARDCIAIVQPALLGVGVSLAALGYAGVPVTLFSVLALLLVIGVGSNYAIFLVEGHQRQGGAFIAVLLCAVTTLLSFGLLAFSSTPALAGFGLTLLIGIGAAVILAPLALTAAPKQPDRPHRPVHDVAAPVAQE